MRITTLLSSPGRGPSVARTFNDQVVIQLFCKLLNCRSPSLHHKVVTMDEDGEVCFRIEEQTGAEHTLSEPHLLEDLPNQLEALRRISQAI